jgi:hypothetical protein
MKVVVTPVIGCVSYSRLDSLRGCHALHEKAVVKGLNGPDSIGPAVAEAMKEILLAEAAGRRVEPQADSYSFLVRFKE